MSRSRRSILKSRPTDRAGFTFVELLMGVALMGIAVAATSGMFLAGKRQMQMQQLQLETTQSARTAIDMMVRDLRLGGACLPVTGDFISLEGINNAQTDEIITRTGLTRPDLSCIRTVVPKNTTIAANATLVPVEAVDGFAVGMRAYIRNPTGTGEYFQVTSVDTTNKTLGKSGTFATSYPEDSGLYAIDERRFYIDTAKNPPELMLRIGTDTAQSFAVGIEKLNLQYQLQRNCPPCDTVSLPASNAEWAIVKALTLSVTARSEKAQQDGTFYRRTVAVNVKPRNLLPK